MNYKLKVYKEFPTVTTHEEISLYTLLNEIEEMQTQMLNKWFDSDENYNPQFRFDITKLLFNDDFSKLSAVEFTERYVK